MITGKDWASMDGNTVQWDRITDSFVIVRAAYTYNGVPHEDATCKIVRPAAAAHGKVFGAYMILGWHGATPEEQADNFIRIYGQRKPGELPPALDLEADSASALGLTVAQCLAWAERAYARLKKAYGTVMIYTSRRVWGDVFGDLSSVMGEAPLWIKIPYPWQTRRPHHPESCPPDGSYEIPKPWAAHPNLPAHIVQYQGDAIGVDGYSGTVDCNKWITWVSDDVKAFQAAHGLVCDGVLGPRTFAAMTQ